uniref:Uncharacterized protein n=1 Tax=Panagrellus redivivus TaxID=6233 RepID=A0A7E4VE60_PANRE
MSTLSNVGAVETRQESRLHIWLGAKKSTVRPNQNRPSTPDYTIEQLASLMSGCGLPEAPKNLYPINMPFNSKFY